MNIIHPISIDDPWGHSGVEVTIPEQNSRHGTILEDRLATLQVEEGSEGAALDRLELEVAVTAVRTTMGKQCSEIIQSLNVQAEAGNFVALELICYLAGEATATLGALVERDPAALKGFARKQPCWPILEVPYPMKRTKISPSVKALEVGADTGAPVNVKAFYLRKRNLTQVRQWVKRFMLQADAVKRAFADPCLWGPDGLVEGAKVTSDPTFSVTLEDVEECLMLPPLTLTVTWVAGAGVGRVSRAETQNYVPCRSERGGGNAFICGGLVRCS